MAEDFEAKFYALLEEHAYGGQAFIEAFKSKGNEARVLADIIGKVEDRDFIPAVLDLVGEFGVSDNPPQHLSAKKRIGPRPKYHLRDMTLGELKETISKGNWPERAWVLTPASARDWFIYAVGLVFLVGCACFIIWALSDLLLEPLSDLSHKMFIRQVANFMFTVFGVSTILGIILVPVAVIWEQMTPGDNWLA